MTIVATGAGGIAPPPPPPLSNGADAPPDTPLPAGPQPPRRWCDLSADERAAKIESVRQLVEGTTLSQGEIARRSDVSASLVSTWRHRYGWTRPEGAPLRPDFGGVSSDPAERTETRRKRMIARLYRIFDRQAGGLEARAKTLGTTTEEKDARTLGVLARTLETLIELDRDDGAKLGEPEPRDRDLDQLDADLAARIAAWAEEGEED